MQTVQLRNGPIKWTIDLSAASANSSPSVPSGATAGVAAASGTYDASTLMSRVHVLVNASAAGGSLAFKIHLYGYDAGLNLWPYLATLNQDQLIAGDTTKYGATALAICLAEVFTVSGENYSRFATKLQGLTGTTPSVTTYIGIEKA
jgi:hypothetical protein